MQSGGKSAGESPAVDLEVTEAAPPGHEPVDEEDARRKQRHPADEDARNHAHARVVRYDGAWHTPTLASGLEWVKGDSSFGGLSRRQGDFIMHIGWIGLWLCRLQCCDVRLGVVFLLSTVRTEQLRCTLTVGKTRAGARAPRSNGAPHAQGVWQERVRTDSAASDDQSRQSQQGYHCPLHKITTSHFTRLQVSAGV
jgi:hypothetical protein